MTTLSSYSLYNDVLLALTLHAALATSMAPNVMIEAIKKLIWLLSSRSLPEPMNLLSWLSVVAFSEAGCRFCGEELPLREFDFEA